MNHGNVCICPGFPNTWSCWPCSSKNDRNDVIENMVSIVQPSWSQSTKPVWRTRSYLCWLDSILFSPFGKLWRPISHAAIKLALYCLFHSLGPIMLLREHVATKTNIDGTQPLKSICIYTVFFEISPLQSHPGGPACNLQIFGTYKSVWRCQSRPVTQSISVSQQMPKARLLEKLSSCAQDQWLAG